jgi:predicted transport protein
MEDTMIRNLEDKTGKKFESWLAIVKKSKLQKHGEIVKMLKEEHGFTHGYANLVAHKAKETDSGSAGNIDDLVSTQYKGKEELKPMYSKLIKAIKAFGKDVELAPKKAYVSIRAKKQFALIQPSTKTRLDVGINLKGIQASGKLEMSGSFNAMCSHRVRIEKENDIDNALIKWLKEAYEQAK